MSKIRLELEVGKPKYHRKFYICLIEFENSKILKPSLEVWETPASELPIEPLFMSTPCKNITTDNKSDKQYYHHPNLAIPDDDHLFYFDPSDNLNAKSCHGHAFHLTTDHKHFLHDATIDHFLDQLDDQELLRHY